MAGVHSMIFGGSRMDGQSTERDTEHVKGLAIAHYLLAGLSVLSAAPFVLFSRGLSSMVAEVTGQLPSILEKYPDTVGLDAPDAQGLDEFTSDALGMAQDLASAAWGLTIAGIALSLLTAAGFWWIGRLLQKHRRWSLCYLTGWFECLAFPFGTVVGIFTVLVLSRPGVKRLFGQD
jgi:hypothetical protein